MTLKPQKQITGNENILSGHQKLSESVYSTDSINKYYIDTPAEQWMPNRKDSQKIADEAWETITKNGVTIRVSTFGRITDLSGTFLQPFDRGKANLDLNEKIFSSVHDNDVGWLCVDLNGTPYLVYELVAEVWLHKPADGYQIHHITNDGYDNSIYNLIYLSPTEHAPLNHVKKNQGEYIPPIQQHLRNIK